MASPPNTAIESGGGAAAAVAARLPRGFVPACTVLAACFAVPLYRLLRFALGSDLYSYIPLVPLISFGLLRLRRDAAPPSAPPRRLALLFAAGGILAAAARAFGPAFGVEWLPQDALCLSAFSFVFCFAALCAWFCGRLALRAAAFPLAFLAFLAPLPVFFADWLTAFFQYSSAAVAYVFLVAAGMPVLRSGDLGFRLPGMNLEVAPQCSGIHSSVALLIISLAAGYVLLRSPWKRAGLAAAAIAVGIVRNGFRIFTIGELCVHIGPQMIDSYIHRTGGWMFFLLSLGPFFLLLFLLVRSERPARAASRRIPA